MIIKPGKGGIKTAVPLRQAQDAVEMVLSKPHLATFETNVIVICHGQYMETGGWYLEDFPTGSTRKLSPYETPP